MVSPDVGGVARARAFAKKLNDAPLAIVDKRRSAHNVSEVMNLIGDVKDKVAVLVDDMIDTAGAAFHLSVAWVCKQRLVQDFALLVPPWRLLGGAILNHKCHQCQPEQRGVIRTLVV